MKARVQITIGEERFDGRLQDDQAPQTCAWFRSLLPWGHRIIHVRWSGEACWIPLGDLKPNVDFENATSHPRPGEVILYPGGMSETEILIAYGPVRFASKVGQLAGNPFLIITEKLERLTEVGRDILWHGARDIAFRWG